MCVISLFSFLYQNLIVKIRRKTEVLVRRGSTVRLYIVNIAFKVLCYKNDLISVTATFQCSVNIKRNHVFFSHSFN